MKKNEIARLYMLLGSCPFGAVLQGVKIVTFSTFPDVLGE
jgi:hypothetical protein